MELFAEGLFPIRQEGFGLAQIDDVVALLVSLNDTHYEVAFTVLVLVINHLPFGFTDPLDDDLFGRLGCNATQSTYIDLHRDAYLVAYGCLRVKLLGILLG